MSEQPNQDGADLDLEAGTGSEGGASAAASTTDKPPVKDGGEGGGEESATLDLKDEDSPKKETKPSASKPSASKPNDVAARNRQKQLDVWSDRYYSGEKELHELPEWIQKEIEDSENGGQPAKAEEKPDTDALLDKKLDERESEKAFKAYQKQLNEKGLKKSEVKKITAHYSELRGHGVPKDLAIKTASKVAGVTLDEAPSDKSGKKTAMKTPKTGGGVHEDHIDESKEMGEILNDSNVSEDKKLEYLEKLITD